VDISTSDQNEEQDITKKWSWNWTHSVNNSSEFAFIFSLLLKYHFYSAYPNKCWECPKSFAMTANTKFDLNQPSIKIYLV
jgi:hypothetical protein